MGAATAKSAVASAASVNSFTFAQFEAILVLKVAMPEVELDELDSTADTLVASAETAVLVSKVLIRADNLASSSFNRFTLLRLSL